jgi:hypothetical protein
MRAAAILALDQGLPMPELDVADPEGTGRSDTILVSVPPPDGAVIVTTLRDRGFAIDEAPIHLLAARAIAEAPRVLIVDVDASGAVEAIESIREACQAELLCIGDPSRAAELGASRSDGRAFERPIDLEALVLAVLSLAEPRAQGTAPPPTFSRVRETAPPARRIESEAPPSEYPSTSDPLDVAVILPTLEDEEAGPTAIAPPDISPDLARILQAAEERIGAFSQPHPPSSPRPEGESDLLLPADLLAALDEPLEPEEEGSVSAGTGGTANNPKPKTGRETTGAAGGAPVEVTASMGSAPASAATAGTGAGGSRPATITMRPEGGREPRTVEPRSVEPRSVVDREVPSAGPALTEPGLPIEAGGPSRPTPALFPIETASAAGEALRIAPSLNRSEPPRADVAPRAPPPLRLPAVLGEGDAVAAVAAVIAARASGSLALGPEGTLRRIVLHDGDIVTAASGAPEETLVAFLAARGDLERDVAGRLANRVPAHGRHAGAALVAHGHLGQEDLWPVLRAHAEWIIGRALVCDEGAAALEDEPPGRLKAEPNVFGGATGAEVFLEQLHRVVPPDVALRRIGGPGARLAEGPRRQLLVECALPTEDEQLVRTAGGRTVSEVLAESEPELADVLYGLASLGVLEVLAPVSPDLDAPSGGDVLDEGALRQRVRARVALVEDGDYFALLGIPRSATGYEVKRAYLELRRAFEPGRVLTAATADLAADVRLVVEVLDEAYEILREPHRRDRYRRAIETGPP